MLVGTTKSRSGRAYETAVLTKTLFNRVLSALFVVVLDVTENEYEGAVLVALSYVWVTQRSLFVTLYEV